MLGFINIYKPSGMTSTAVVKMLKKRFHIKKIGHFGTLDPLACGILPIAIGKATRLFNHSLNKSKRYIAVFDFGYTTDSLDITGVETQRTDYIPDEQRIIDACTKLIGKQLQVPPMFSAKNVNGVRAYDLARQGIQVELKPNEIEIYDIKYLGALDNNRFKFDITCSSGTYIRSIARDMGMLLDSCACMSSLERTMAGAFDISSAIKLDDALEVQDLEEIVLSPLQVFKHFDIINIDDKVFNELLNGREVSYQKLKNPTFVVFNNKLVGVAKSNSQNLVLDTFLYEE